MTKTAWTEHLKACKGLGLSKKEIREWYWAEKEAKEAELEAVKVSSDMEESSEDEPSEDEEECAMVSKGPVRKASKTLEDLLKSMTTELKKGLLTRRQSLALVEKSAKDFIMSRNVSKIRRH